MKECTFVPQLIVQPDHPAERPHRTLDEFLQDQTKFQQRKHDDIAKISTDNNEKVKGSVSLRPQIDDNSAALAQHKPRDAPIYERLFGLSRRSIKVSPSGKKEGNQSARVRTSQEPREMRLYKLALEKKEEEKRRQLELQQKKRASKPAATANSDPLVALGFRKEFNAATINVGAKEKATYDQMSIKSHIQESRRDDTDRDETGEVGGGNGR